MIAAAFLIGSAAIVHAAPKCGPRDKVISILTNKFKETRVAGGIAKSGAYITEIYAAPGGKTFTVVTTNTAGISCLRVAGVDWQQKPIKPKGVSH